MNDKLESSLVKAEERIKEMTGIIKQNSISQNKIELEEIEMYTNNKLLMFNSSYYSEKPTALSDFSSQIEKEMYSKNEVFNSLPK